MSLLKKLIMTLTAIGGEDIEPEWEKDANIFSEYSVTVLAAERITAQPSTAYIAGVLEVEEAVTASIASAYSLGVA